MKYSISYEIERYDVRLTINGNDLGGNNFFYCEEDAVGFALKYERDHPGWKATILRIERAIIEEV